VDATEVLPIVHQWHDYSQVPGGVAEVHQGVEAQAIRRSHDIWHSPPSVADADWVLSPEGLKSGNCRGDRLRCLESHLRYRLKWKWLSYCLRTTCLRGRKYDPEELYEAIHSKNRSAAINPASKSSFRRFLTN
jgi:hypothetical protein